MHNQGEICHIIRVGGLFAQNKNEKKEKSFHRMKKINQQRRSEYYKQRLERK